MSTSRKALKIICIIMLVLSIIGIVLGALMLAGFAVMGYSTVDVQGQSFDAGLVTGSVGIVFIVANVLDLIVAVLGIKGCNTPSKIKPFLIICYITLACMVISVVMSVVQGTAIGTSLVCLIITGIETVLGHNIQKETQK
jgi:hypothetical protein